MQLIKFSGEFWLHLGQIYDNFSGSFNFVKLIITTCRRIRLKKYKKTGNGKVLNTVPVAEPEVAPWVLQNRSPFARSCEANLVLCAQ